MLFPVSPMNRLKEGPFSVPPGLDPVCTVQNLGGTDDGDQGNRSHNITRSCIHTTVPVVGIPPDLNVRVVYYESIKRELKTKLIYDSPAKALRFVCLL